MKTRPRQVTISIAIFVLLISISLLLSGFGYLYYLFEKKSITKAKHEEIEAVAKMKISQIVQWRKGRIAEIEVTTQANFLVDAIKEWLKDKYNKPLETKIINSLVLRKDNYIYEDIFLVSVVGEPLISTHAGTVRLDSVTGLKVLEAARNGRIESTDLYYCPVHKKIHYDLIAPVADNNHLPIAVLIFRVDPEKYLYPLVRSWPMPGKTSETLLVRKDGNDVLFLNELRMQKNTALKLRIPLTHTGIPAVKAVLGYRGTFEGDDYRNVPVVSYIGPIPDTPWFMVAKVDKSEIYAELKYRAVVITIFTFVLIVFVITGISLIYKSRQKNIYQNLLLKEKELNAAYQEFKTTLYSIGDAVITTDDHGTIRHLNPVAELLTGWKESEASGIPVEKVFTIISEESRDVAESPIDRVLLEGIIVGLANHTILISKDGKETPIADSGAPIKNETGEISGVVLVFRDQTDERGRTNELIEMNKKFRALFDNNASAIAIIEPDTTISMVNKAYCALSGYTEQEVVGMSWTKQIPPSDLERLEEYNRRRLANPDDAPEEYEFRFYRKDGEIRTGLMSVSVVENPTRIITSFIDITGRKLAEELVIKTSTELKLIFSNMLNAFIIWESVFDNNGIYVSFRFGYFNDAYARITGLTQEAVKGKDVFEVWPETEQSWVEVYGKVAITGIPATFDMYHSPTLKWYHCNAYRPSVSKTQVCVMFDDITEMKQAEEAVNEKVKEMEEFISLSVDREHRMIELKQKMNELAIQQGNLPPYDLDFMVDHNKK